jgi:homoserine O-acetyltransferase
MPELVPQKKIVETKSITLFDAASPLTLEAGGTLPLVVCAYETYGKLNAAGDNTILICHAVSGNAHAAFYNSEQDKVAGWWDGLIGDGKAIDTEKYFVVCSSLLGSSVGTTGPTSVNPETDEPYRMTFPLVTVRDMVRVQKKLLDELGCRKLVSVVGASVGAFQVLEWGVMFPDAMQSIIPIAAAAQQTAWALAYNHVRREMILNDPTWQNGNYSEQPKSLELVRQLGMIPYRSPLSFAQRFARRRKDEAGDKFDFETNPFDVQSYLSYQGKKFAARFDANAYLVLTKAFDLFDLASGRGSLEEICRSIKARTLSIGISSDMLYLPDDQKKIADLVPKSEYAELVSDFGHDAFLIEYETLNPVIREFLGRLQ